MELKYTETGTIINGDTFGDNTVAMLLYGNIDVGQDSINSTQFINEMNYYNQMGKQVVVKINSNGGAVYGGYGIMEAVEDIGADTYITGMAGSIAGVISQSGKRRFANRRATWMAHAPSTKTGKAPKALINIVREGLKNALTEKSSLDEEEIGNIMNSDKELYYNADDMYAKGLVDKIIKSGEMLDTQLLNFKDSDELYTAYDSLLNNVKPIKMENLMNHLGLENKTEADVLNIVKELEVEAAKVEPLENQIGVLEAEVKTLKDAQEEAQKNKATELVNSAIKDGRIKEDVKDAWTDFAMENFVACETTLSSIPVAKTAEKLITNVIEKENKEVTKGKSYKELAQDHPEVLLDLMKNNPEEYAILVKEMNN